MITYSISAARAYLTGLDTVGIDWQSEYSYRYDFLNVFDQPIVLLYYSTNNEHRSISDKEDLIPPDQLVVLPENNLEGDTDICYDQECIVKSPCFD